MEEDLIEVANRMKPDQFIQAYMPHRNEWTSWAHPKTNAEYSISLQSSTSLARVDFEACFRIIEATSAEDYKKSKDGWHPKAKQKEMRLLDLKYLLVKRDGHVEGFTSFMPTYEDHCPVIYCYEIHLLPWLKGCVNALKLRPAKIRLTNVPRTGMGKLLMGLLDIVAANIKGVEKVMLTVFLRNDKAVQFYRKIGFKIDKYSPLPRVLRDGRIVEESYIILSKAVGR